MPKNIQKSLNKYLSKINNKPNNSPILNPLFSKKWIKSRCKHVKTLSFPLDGDQNDNRNTQNDDAATLSDIDQFLYENFQSLYFQNDDVLTNEENSTNSNQSETLDDDRRDRDRNRNRNRDNPSFDLNVCGSNRFLIGESSRSATTSSEPNDSKLPEDCIAVLRPSPCPYDDFRRSMEEMVESRLLDNGRVDWDFMEEILFCYLNLNEKKSHRFVLSAFVDLIVVLRSEKTPARSPIAVSKRERKKNA